MALIFAGCGLYYRNEAIPAEVSAPRVNSYTENGGVYYYPGVIFMLDGSMMNASGNRLAQAAVKSVCGL